MPVRAVILSSNPASFQPASFQPVSLQGLHSGSQASFNPVAKRDPFIDQKMYLFNCMNIILVHFCLYAFLSSHFVQLLVESCERHPTILEMAVRHCKPEVGRG